MAGGGISALIFDFDGTMIDSDAALVAPFIELGITQSEISFGHAVAQECQRLGISMEDYVNRYDVDASHPFPGMTAAVRELGRWSICSNKHPRSAKAELARFGWSPEVVMCADDFDWRHKSIAPVIDQMGLSASQVAMVGDSQGDLRCAQEVGCTMVWAGWNPRVREAAPEGLVLSEPGELLGLYG